MTPRLGLTQGQEIEMIRTRTFEWAIQFPMGSGWKPTNTPAEWYPGAGFLAAHDTIEHLSSKADWAHELRATGVSLYTLPGIRHRDNGSVAEDIINFAAKHEGHEFELPEAPARWNKPLPRDSDERRIQSFATEAREIVDRGMAAAREAGHDIPLVAQKNGPLFVDKLVPWLRLGFAAANRVYGVGKGRVTGEMMDSLRDAVNEDHDRLQPVKGERLRVTVDTKAHTFTVARENTSDLPQRKREMRNTLDKLDALAKSKGKRDPLLDLLVKVGEEIAA